MRVPLTWLREYCDPPLDVAGIAERLTMTGTKVEAIHHHGVREPERFVIGRVLRAQAHPDADRLRVCAVDLGAARPEGPATIVCGAPNVAAGQLVAVARPGAVMPDGTRLGAAKLRGVVSEGMILAEDELAIGVAHEGILVLDGLAPDGAPLAPGAALAEVLPIATDVLELEVTPNRPDCLGVWGVARELHAATGAALGREPWSEDPGGDGPLEAAAVEVLCPDLCPRFTARAFTDVRIGPSPGWLKARLMAAGQRPINNVVDITNYVMLLTAQPLHAFDLDRVAGARLVVRRARAGEVVRTLDGQDRELDEEVVLIADDEGPTSIAGLMGGERSEVGAQTTRVLLEAASWDGPNIHRSSALLGLRSEASARFEKGLPQATCAYAQAVASRLMVELSGARLLPGTVDVRVRQAPPAPIALRSGRVERILGMAVPRARQAAILGALGFGTSETEVEGEEALAVEVPPVRRADVSREADLIEEVARIAGLDKLPASLPRRRGAYGVLSREQRLRRRAADVLVGRGLYEAVGWTFSAPEAHDRLRLDGADARRRAVSLEDPLSHEHSQLRTMLLGSLLDVAGRNAARGRGDLGLFEQGAVFRADARAGVLEHRALGVLLMGRTAPATWRSKEPPPADFFAIKALLEALAQALGVRVECRPAEAGRHPYLHPARAAEVLLADADAGAHGEAPAAGDAAVLGWLGELHPLIAESALGGRVAAAAAMELHLDLLVGAAAREPVHEYRQIGAFPPLLRDIAVSVPEEVPAAAVVDAIRGRGGEALEDVRLFDVYTGAQAGQGRRSLALSVSFRAHERTLTDEDVAPAWEAIVEGVRELGGELRG
jgi:phenylalanyl-tRNA synthetase beta chain